MFVSAKNKVAALVVLLALMLVPAPLLPPLALAGKMQSILGIGWKGAYLITAIGLQVVLYASLGVLAAFAAGPAKTRRGRWMQLLAVPLIVVGVAIVVRSLKLGHVPMLANAVVPIVACVLGVLIGLVFRQHGWRVTVGSMLVLGIGMVWAYWPGVSSELARATEVQLRRIAEASSRLPNGEERFGVLVQTVFTPIPTASTPTPPSAVEHNRAAILALGITLGHERLARYVGLQHDSELVRIGVVARAGTTLRGRDDWARHYCLSAALAVVGNPFVSDAGGLIKEELDALTHGSGFSFGDLAADRAGVRFAEAATGSETAALAMQSRLQSGFKMDDFFPAISDLAENLTVEEFRRDYGGVGSERYRETLRDIEQRLDACAALALP
jgi:hypothetical protein